MKVNINKESWIDFFAILGLFFIVMVLWSYLTGFVLKFTFPFYVNGYFQGIILLVLSIAFSGEKGAFITDYKLGLDNLLKSIPRGLIIGFILAVLMGVSSWLLEQLRFPIEDQVIASELAKVDGYWEFLPLLLLVGLVVPVAEEVFFRGFCYRLFRQSFGIVPGIFLSGIFFGLMHFDYYRVLPLAIAGMVLAWAYEKSESLWVPIIAHSTWNAAMALLIFGNIL